MFHERSRCETHRYCFARAPRQFQPKTTCFGLFHKVHSFSMTSVVEFRDVGYAINGRALLEGVSFKVDAGETLVLLGRSGSGKTTTLKLVNRLLEPTSGQVFVEGRKTTDWEPIRLRRRIGYVIQEI